MKSLFLTVAGLILLTGCETKVVNQQPPATGQPLVVERERPVIIQQEQPQQKPDVQTNIHVDR